MSTATNQPRTGIALTSDTKPMSLVPSSFADIVTLSERLARSSLIPTSLRGKPDDVAIIIATGLEFGFSPFVSLRQIYVVEGKPALSADAQLAVILQHRDICEYFRLVEATPEKATYETKRRGWPEPARLTYTIQDARNAGLANKPNWKLNPLKMLQNRAKSTLAGAVYPDLLLGMPSLEDAGEEAGFERARDITPPAPSTAPTETGARVLASIQPAPEPEAVTPEVVDDAPEGNSDTGELRAPADAPAERSTTAPSLSREAQLRMDEVLQIGNATALQRWAKHRESDLAKLEAAERDQVIAAYHQRLEDLS